MSDDVRDIFNFRDIDGLTTSGQPTEAQLRTAARDGYEVILNLATDDPRYALPGEAGIVESLGMLYVNIPVAFDRPTEDDLLAFFHALEEHKGKRVHVHCAANMRVTAFVGLHRLINLGLTRDEAFAPMRTVWEPEGVWAAFIGEMIAKHAPSP